MTKFDEDSTLKEKLVFRDSGGQIIKVGDEALLALSSTRIALVTVLKVCNTVVKVEHKTDTKPDGCRPDDPGGYWNYNWKSQVWPSALYILKRDEENNI